MTENKIEVELYVHVLDMALRIFSRSNNKDTITFEQEIMLTKNIAKDITSYLATLNLDDVKSITIYPKNKPNIIKGKILSDKLNEITRN